MVQFKRVVTLILSALGLMWVIAWVAVFFLKMSGNLAIPDGKTPLQVIAEKEDQIIKLRTSLKASNDQYMYAMIDKENDRKLEKMSDDLTKKIREIEDSSRPPEETPLEILEKRKDDISLCDSEIKSLEGCIDRNEMLLKKVMAVSGQVADNAIRDAIDSSVMIGKERREELIERIKTEIDKRQSLERLISASASR